MFRPCRVIIRPLCEPTNVKKLRTSLGSHWCFFWRCDPTRVMASSFLRFLDHTQRRTTVRRTPLDVWSARRRDLYLTTQNTHNRRTSMPPVGFEPTISAGKRPQTYALDGAATGTGPIDVYKNIYNGSCLRHEPLYISFVNINGIPKMYAVLNITWFT